MRTPFSKSRKLDMLQKEITEKTREVIALGTGVDDLHRLVKDRDKVIESPNDKTECLDCRTEIDLDASDHIRIHIVSAVSGNGEWTYWSGHPLEIPICLDCWEKIKEEERRQSE